MNSTNNDPLVIQDDIVVTLDYTLKVEDSVVDSSADSEPIQFIQGQGHIIPGLESQLYGLKVGDNKKIMVSPDEGYGEVDIEAFTDIPRQNFPKHIPLEPGVALQVKNSQGEVMDAYIAEVHTDNVRLDFNHPLAGKTLDFEITVVDLRDATEEELAHGHVHSEEGDEDDYDEEEEDDGLN